MDIFYLILTIVVCTLHISKKLTDIFVVNEFMLTESKELSRRLMSIEERIDEYAFSSRGNSI